jgi:uncharacterized phage protein gp47/JayE
MASEFTLPTAEQMRDNMLRTFRAGLIDRGVESPNVTPGSDEYVRMQAIADQLEIAMANTQVKADAASPSTATGQDLANILEIYGMSFREAAGATGNVVFNSTATSAVIVGTQLIDGSGLRFEVTVGGTYANGATIPVAGVDTGKETNHAAGDALRWVSAPPFSQPTALVATGGLTGGVDEEDDETARQRLYTRLRVPPAAGNWEHICELAETSSTLVQKGFVYPCANGPANFGLAVVGYATETSKSRVVSSVVVANDVKPYVDGQLALHADSIVTSVVDVDFDVSVELSLPASPKASPAGPGGGWTDGTTWPRNVNASTTFRCAVTAVTSALQFTVDAPSTPTASVTQIAWLSTVTWTVYTATVTSFSGTSGAYVITIDRPFTGIAVGDYISPNAANIETYFNAILSHFASMGPGEKVATSSAAFYRAFRHPTPAQSWPYKVDSTMLRAITNSGDEVADAGFLYRTSDLAPSVPGSVATAPNIYVPHYVGIYEKLT